MRKRLLADDQLNEVIRLKQSGASWLKIQQQTRVPRRVAKRAYEDWERNQSFNELKESRRQVAAEAFREHVDSVIKLGRFLAIRLDIPTTISPLSPDAAQILDGLWQESILGEPQDYRQQGLSDDMAERERRRATRQNRMLFQSLQDHMRGEMRWEALKKWESAWEDCRKLYSALHAEATTVVRNFLNQEPGFEKLIKKETGREDAITQIINEILTAIWSRIRDDDVDAERAIFEVMPGPRNVPHLAWVGVGNSVFLTFTNKSSAEKAALLGNQAAKNLLLGENKGVMESLKGKISAMRHATEELADMLNPLVLRPIILRTRCELCPA